MVRLVDGFHFEAEGTVEPHGGFIGGVDVEHCGFSADRLEVLETGEGESFAEALPVEVWVYGNHVDFSSAHGSRVQFCPAEGGQPTIAFVK